MLLFTAKFKLSHVWGAALLASIFALTHVRTLYSYSYSNTLRLTCVYACSAASTWKAFSFMAIEPYTNENFNYRTQREKQVLINLTFIALYAITVKFYSKHVAHSAAQFFLFCLVLSVKPSLWGVSANHQPSKPHMMIRFF